jgi:hypothetical protein
MSTFGQGVELRAQHQAAHSPGGAAPSQGQVYLRRSSGFGRTGSISVFSLERMLLYQCMTSKTQNRIANLVGSRAFSPWQACMVEVQVALSRVLAASALVNWRRYILYRFMDDGGLWQKE